jgi:predicted secreted protein
MRLSRAAALATAALLAVLIPGAAAAASRVNVPLYWQSGAATSQAVVVPVGGTVQVMMQVGSDGGYEATVTGAADPDVFTTDGPQWFHTKLGPGAAGGWTYELWTFTAVAAGSTTFGAKEARSWETGPGTLHALQLVATADGIAALDTRVTSESRCTAGYTTVGVAVGDHVAIQLASNATTGFLWTEASVPNTNAFRPDVPQGAYTAPGPSAPIGAGGYQTFGYTGLAPGSSPLDLVYARASGEVGARCAPKVSVGAAAVPGPVDDTIVPIDAPEATSTPPAATAEPELSAPPAATAAPEVTEAPVATPPVTSGDGSATPPGPGSALLVLLAVAAAGAIVTAAARMRRARA